MHPTFCTISPAPPSFFLNSQLIIITSHTHWEGPPWTWQRETASATFPGSLPSTLQLLIFYSNCFVYVLTVCLQVGLWDQGPYLFAGLWVCPGSYKAKCRNWNLMWKKCFFCPLLSPCSFLLCTTFGFYIFILKEDTLLTLFLPNASLLSHLRLLYTWQSHAYITSANFFKVIELIFDSCLITSSIRN